MPRNNNRSQQTLPDTPRHCHVLLECVWQCLLAPVVVFCCLLACHAPWICLGDVWEMSGGCLSDIHGNRRRSDVFVEYLGSQSLQYGANTPIWHSPERQNFFHLTILRHWNIKMVAYKLSKKYWVMHFIAIFRPVREKLLVTVALDHPVVNRANVDIFFPPISGFWIIFPLINCCG